MGATDIPIEITPSEYAGWRHESTGQPHVLLDVRETWEHDTAHLSGDVLIPMNEVPARLGDVPLDQDVVVYCHHGVRSFQVAYYLRQHGYDRVRSLSGGIARWSEEIDPGVPHY